MKITMKRRAAAWVVALAMLTGLTACGCLLYTSYETDRAAVPYRMLIWYAQYFDVSMDYIFGLCDDKMCIRDRMYRAVAFCLPSFTAAPAHLSSV